MLQRDIRTSRTSTGRICGLWLLYLMLGCTDQAVIGGLRLDEEPQSTSSICSEDLPEGTDGSCTEDARVAEEEPLSTCAEGDCEEDAETDASATDSGVEDVGTDAGVTDSGVADTGTDAGVTDSGVVDAGTDAGVKDSGVVDAGIDVCAFGGCVVDSEPTCSPESSIFEPECWSCLVQLGVCLEAFPRGELFCMNQAADCGLF